MSDDKILILGTNGMLGHALALHAGALGVTRADCNFLDASFLQELDRVYDRTPFGAVINAAAYTAVDAAEREDSGNLLRVNAIAPGEIAAWCAKKGIPFVHFSTDYVFDGSGDAPWREDDATGPLNAYGRSKLAGERAVAAAGGKHLIFRTSWLYAGRGKNFFTTMREKMREKESLSVVSDQVGAPTFVPHLAVASLRALEAARRLPAFPSGIYHLCNAGEASWHQFAQAIWEEEQARGSHVVCREIAAISSADYGAPAPRPLNSRLDCTRTREVLDVWLPAWDVALRDCYEVLGGA